MADLRTNFLGVKSPNPFWLASAPPTDRKVNVERAFRAGWGGVVWKTLGEAGPPVVNVSGARYGAIHGPDRRLIAMNNIELITDRDLEINLQEIKEVKRAWPDRALIVSLMVPCEEKSWEAILARVEETECDGVELNFGCPHGMSERGMGSAVGQVPEYVEMVARWCKAHTRMPVIVKLTPNITDIRQPARAAKNGGADAVSLINTINSIMNIDLDHMTPDVVIDGKGTHGGMCGPAVKPIALSMVSEIARDSVCAGLPISAIGGITTWRDAAEFIALGAGTVQVCTAAMTYGFKVVQEMVTGLADYMDAKGYATIEDFRGRAIPSITDWQYLNLNYVAKAEIDQKLCIQCGRCHIVCEDTSHQAIFARINGKRQFVVNEAECVGCNSARSSVRSRTASRSCIKSQASIRAPGSTMTARPATGRRIRTTRRSTPRRRSSGCASDVPAPVGSRRRRSRGPAGDCALSGNGDIMAVRQGRRCRLSVRPSCSRSDEGERASYRLRPNAMTLALDRLLPRALIVIALAALLAGGAAWAAGDPTLADWLWAAGAIPVIVGLVVSIVARPPRGPPWRGRGRASVHDRGAGARRISRRPSSWRSCMRAAPRSRNSRSPAQSATCRSLIDRAPARRASGTRGRGGRRSRRGGRGRRSAPRARGRGPSG